MQPRDATEMRRSFVNCSRGEAGRLTLPPLEELAWSETDVLAWRDPKADQRGYVVVEEGTELVGVVLRALPPRPGLFRLSACAFCVTTHSIRDVAMYSARRAGAAGKLGNVLGTYVCSDLACNLYVRGKRHAMVPQPGETLTVEQRVERLRHNVGVFVRQVMETRA